MTSATLRPSELAADVRAVLERVTWAGTVLMLPPALERKLYERVNRALEALGAKWNRGKGGHVFASEEGLMHFVSMLESGVVPAKNAEAFFPTPREVVERMLDLAMMPDVQRKPRCLEPSAGVGAIALLVRGLYPQYEIHCVESNTERAMKLAQVGLPHVWNEDFLTWKPAAATYHRILMNPPFSVPDDSTAWITHLRRALVLLHPDGVLVSVVPSGCMHRTDRKHLTFRDSIAGRATYDELDPKAFKSSGTMVNTGLLVVEGIAR
jgi:hypothetical protein